MSARVVTYRIPFINLDQHMVDVWREVKESFGGCVQGFFVGIDPPNGLVLRVHVAPVTRTGTDGWNAVTWLTHEFALSAALETLQRRDMTAWKEQFEEHQEELRRAGLLEE